MLSGFEPQGEGFYIFFYSVKNLIEILFKFFF